MKKRILYVIISPSHKRCFESFEEHPNLEQMILGPAPIPNKTVPEDYSDFKIKNIKYIDKNFKSIVNYINSFKPDIYVQSDFSIIHNKVFQTSSKKYKRVYVSHGLIGNHVGELADIEKFNTLVWRGMDLYCGANNFFADWIKKVTNVGDNKILLNALPQLDIIHNPVYYDSYKNTVLNITKFPKAKKTILFMGFCCQDRNDFKAHNADYFKTAIELGKIAKKNDWLIMIKPRQQYSEILKFMQNHAWAKQFINDYKSLESNTNVHFIGPAASHIYKYYFADAFVFNGCSTAEIEASAIQKPLFIVRTDQKCIQSGYDPYDSVSSGAATLVSNLSDMESKLIDCFENGKFCLQEKQLELLKKSNITFDGNMSKRIQNKLLEL